MEITDRSYLLQMGTTVSEAALRCSTTFLSTVLILPLIIRTGSFSYAIGA